jgi:hypothetical protein
MTVLMKRTFIAAATVMVYNQPWGTGICPHGNSFKDAAS